MCTTCIHVPHVLIYLKCTFAIMLSRPPGAKAKAAKSVFSRRRVCACVPHVVIQHSIHLYPLLYHTIICDRIDLFALVGVNYGEHGFYDSLSFDSMVFFDPSFVVFVSFCRMLLLLFGWPLVLRHHLQS